MTSLDSLVIYEGLGKASRGLGKASLDNISISPTPPGNYGKILVVNDPRLHISLMDLWCGILQPLGLRKQ